MGDNMKILYRQNHETMPDTSFYRLNITNCHFKEIAYKKDYKITTLKAHSHTEYEIHMVLCGKQRYETADEIYEVEQNEFILIPPRQRHKIVFSSDDLVKYSITFNFSEDLFNSVMTGELSSEIISSIHFISEEFKRKSSFSVQLIENRLFEIVALLFRMAGLDEEVTSASKACGDEVVEMAKKFISDNIERNLSVSDVSAYCHLSERQLTRKFIEAEEISPAKYILSQRMKRIGEQVKNTDFSFRQISEQFSFNNEYYFNTAFKKHFGVPPLTYRKMHR